MNQLKDSERLQNYSKKDLQSLSKTELIGLVMTSQLALGSIKVSSSHLKKEKKKLKEQIKKRRKELKSYDKFFSNLNLNPKHISSNSLTEFDLQNYSVKNFLEMQDKKIQYQEQKIKELQIKSFKKSKSSAGLAKRKNNKTLHPDLKSKNFIRKLTEITQKPKNLILADKYFEVPIFFHHSSDQIKEHRKLIENEVSAVFSSLVSKYSPKIFSKIIRNRSKWDQDYTSLFKSNARALNQILETHLKSSSLMTKILHPNTQVFSEGKTIRSFFSTYSLILDKRRENQPSRSLTDKEIEEVEIQTKW